MTDTLDPAIAEIVTAIEQGEGLLRSKMAEKAKLDTEIAALTKALTGQRREAQTGRPRARRASVKSIVMSALIERGAYGVNARAIVDLAGQKGVPVQGSSVSSLLSRMKGDGIVEYDGNAYRLPDRKQ